MVKLAETGIDDLWFSLHVGQLSTWESGEVHTREFILPALGRITLTTYRECIDDDVARELHVQMDLAIAYVNRQLQEWRRLRRGEDDDGTT